MENANKDEADRCLEIAEKALKAGDVEKARRLTKKSLQLCATQRAEDFLSELKNSESGEDGGEQGGEGEGEGVRRRRRRSKRSEEREKIDEEPEYTQEQKEAVERVLSSRDYYDILGVSREATEADLKRQYRKLALQLHPDKNRAPRADDAFKAVSNAYGILNDQEKRSRYDRFGEEGINSSARASHRHGYYTDIDPDELFRTFFGDSFSFDNNFMTPFTNHRRRRFFHHPHTRREEPVSGWVKLCQLMPIIFLLVMSVFSTFIFPLLNTPPYYLYRTSSHPIERHTKYHNIPYYVSESFSDDYPTTEAIRRLERDVLLDKKYLLREECYEAKRKLGLVYRRQKQVSDKQPEPCRKLQELVRG